MGASRTRSRRGELCTAQGVSSLRKSTQAQHQALQRHRCCPGHLLTSTAPANGAVSLGSGSTRSETHSCSSAEAAATGVTIRVASAPSWGTPSALAGAPRPADTGPPLREEGCCSSLIARETEQLERGIKRASARALLYVRRTNSARAISTLAKRGKCASRASRALSRVCHVQTCDGETRPCPRR